jgi:hypothetical protein
LAACQRQNAEDEQDFFHYFSSKDLGVFQAKISIVIVNQRLSINCLILLMIKILKSSFKIQFLAILSTIMDDNWYKIYHLILNYKPKTVPISNNPSNTRNQSKLSY